jgi:hypothetical protein
MANGARTKCALVGSSNPNLIPWNGGPSAQHHDAPGTRPEDEAHVCCGEESFPCTFPSGAFRGLDEAGSTENFSRVNVVPLDSPVGFCGASRGW